MKRKGWTIAVSWGDNGGFYWYSGFSKRLCLWRLAITWIPNDLDEIIDARHVNSPIPAKCNLK